ncbi:coiled-coil domain-containing protein 112 isoform X1 [Varanus komodoensis]|uniref:coiled-coil domain-containing protein 112 isoform X1 n=1 Tax=Varanus komodoensis TaxID=61221 RepID=UPI001CF7DACE|nr:coiled-coil domain-containing protein 112 isoform X1 [Varanus komodoensis]
MAALATAAPVGATRYRQNDSCFSTPRAVQPFPNGKMKADQVKKTEFIRTRDKLKNQLVNIEKDKNILLFNKKSDFRKEYCTLEELEHKLTKNRKAEKAKIQQKLARIHNNVKGLQRQLKDVKPTPEFVDRLREMMEETEMAINAFKEEQRQIYEELIKEEKTATNELNALERKIEMWTLGTSATGRIFKQGLLPLDKEIQTHLPEEVLELERFLQQTGGRQGGWDECDHQIFLKVWTKHKGKPSYINEALDYLPDKTRETIQQHEKWHQEFLILEAQKKESIQKWKMNKQQERQKILAEKEKPVLNAAKFQHEEAQKQKADEERKKRLVELKEWKKHKAVAFAMKQAAQLQEEEEKEKKKQREHKRQFQMKLLLEEYTRKKKEQEECLRLDKEKREEAEREEKRRTAAEQIVKFQERKGERNQLHVLFPEHIFSTLKIACWAHCLGMNRREDVGKRNKPKFCLQDRDLLHVSILKDVAQLFKVAFSISCHRGRKANTVEPL